MTALWIEEAAERFWAAAGGAPDAFPRDLRRGIAFALPLAVVELPRLRVASVSAWLAQRGVGLRITERDRLVRACLVVHQGAGVVFLDGTDPEDERRFSLAHEVAHFIVQYALPRQRAVDRLGDQVLPVLDGMRSASLAERVDAVLSGTTLRLELHLMERTPDGHPFQTHVSIAERRADELALELVAPFETVRRYAGDRLSRAIAESVLVEVFGLPTEVARVYARQIAPSDRPRHSFVRSLLAQLDP